MLAGVLAVLKVIGIVLLVVLALIILILLLIMFVPLRYKVDGNIPRTNLEDNFDIKRAYMNVSFSWLLHFISGGITYPDKMQFEVKVLGIKVFPSKKKEKDTDKKDEGKSENGVIEKSDMGDRPKQISSSDGLDKSNEDNENKVKNTDKDQESDHIEISIDSGDADDKTAQDQVNDMNSSDQDDKDKSILDFVWNIIDKVSNILETPQNVFGKIKYTISRVCGKISMVKATVENDIFKRAFDLVIRKLFRILKMIMPQKCDITFCLGTGDPAQTAELVGAYSILYPIVYDKVRFEPDYEQMVFELDAHMKGRITAFTVVYGALVCYLDKDVKKVIRRFKKIINS